MKKTNMVEFIQKSSGLTRENAEKLYTGIQERITEELIETNESWIFGLKLKIGYVNPRRVRVFGGDIAITKKRISIFAKPEKKILEKLNEKLLGNN